MPKFRRMPIIDLSRVPDDATFEWDMECRGCGYNLRGVRILGNCPECNHENRDSLVPNTLPYMDPRWLSRVRLGLRMVFIGFCLQCAPVIGILLISIGDHHPIAAGIAEAALATPLFGFMLASIGGFIATPANSAIDRVLSWRRIRVSVRICAAVAFVAAFIFAVLLVSFAMSPPIRVIWPWLVLGWIGLVGLTYSFAEWLYCLAQHAPDYPFDSAIGGSYSGRLLGGSIALTGIFIIDANFGWQIVAAPSIAILTVVDLLFVFFLWADVYLLGNCVAHALKSARKSQSSPSKASRI